MPFLRRRLCAVALCCLPVLAPGAEPARAAGPGDGRVRPVPGAVQRGWDPPPERWDAGHRGVDLTASPGAPVRAAAGGRVSFAGTVAGRGVVSVELTGTGDPPLRTTYEPVRARVRAGDRVGAGEVLGVLEADGSHCPAGCLHWGLRRGETYLDPLSLLHRGPSRLLPVLGVPLPEESGGGKTEEKREEGSGEGSREGSGEGQEPEGRHGGAAWQTTAGGAQSAVTGIAGAVALASAAVVARVRLRRPRPPGGEHPP